MDTTLTGYPVHYAAERAPRYRRIQLLIRLIVFLVLGLFGLSLGVIYLAAYLALPAWAALRLLEGRSGQEYLASDGVAIVRGLRWYSSITSWLGLVTESAPALSSAQPTNVKIEIEPAAKPTPAVITRILVGLPSGLALAFLGFIAGLVWLWSALRVLVGERIGETAHTYLAGVQRWALRLLAYQAGLVDEYPPFSFGDSPPALPAAPHAP